MSEQPIPVSATGAAAGLRAVILAGGRGVRLQPFTINFPKPLVPLGDTPILEVLLKRLISFGVTDVTLTLGHLAELIKTYFQKYPGVQQYINSTLEKARELGYVETLSGRRRHYPNINSANARPRRPNQR